MYLWTYFPCVHVYLSAGMVCGWYLHECFHLIRALCPARRQNFYDGVEEFFVVLRESGSREEVLSKEQHHRESKQVAYLEVHPQLYSYVQTGCQTYIAI